MKRALWIMVVFVAVGVLFFFALFEVEWRDPSGPHGGVNVRYTIPVLGKEMGNGKRTGDTVFSFWIAGHVERVQLIPVSFYNEHGFVALYIKTTEGWYESPRGSLSHPIDWERGVEVHFLYPEGMELRKQVRLSHKTHFPSWGQTWIRWRDSYLPGHLDGGDIASVHFRNESEYAIAVQRTNGLNASWGWSRKKPGIAAEIIVSE